MRPKQSHNHEHSRFMATITAIDIQSECQTLPHECRTIPPNRHSPINRTYAKLFRGSLDISKLRIDTHSVMLVPYNADSTLIPLEELGQFAQYLMEPRVSTRLWKRTCASRKPWYAFHETPAMSQVLRPKILCKDIARRPTFWIDRSGITIPRHSTYYIVPRDESILDTLCEYLNGKYARDWLVENCQRAANGFIRTQSNVLKRLPIPSELVTNTWRRPRPLLDARNLESRSVVLEQVS